MQTQKKNSLNNIWHIDMQLDTTEQDKREGLDSTIEFTKTGLIDWLLTDEYTRDYCEDCLNYDVTDEELKHLLRELNSDWKVLEIIER